MWHLVLKAAFASDNIGVDIYSKKDTVFADQDC